jgi:putative peptide zinc metalloprotease protein
MAVDRPTFSESWYRVANLKPRLRGTVQTYRQQFRGQTWHVLQDPASNQFSRLSESAYRFVGLLNGRRTIAEAWEVCNEQLGDAAPTQGEAIQLLGQLYVSNLLQSDLPPDAAGLFKRYQKRVRREVQGVLSNLLFIRIPLFDPDRFLDAFLPVVGWIFSWVGLVLWALIVGTGLFVVGSRIHELSNRAEGMFANMLMMKNVLLMYGSFIGVKVFHEFAHAFACKRFGRLQGSGGEVHTIGIMFLVFAPMPYVDTSSSWAFQKKWHRVVVGAAGMLVELAIAAMAAVIWARTSSGTAVNAVAYNVMFIASVSTLIFNGNPLLRFDAYYILSDILEIPNLAQRSKEYIYYLVKRYVWGVRRPRNPATTAGERVWFFFYGIASTIYRVIISVGILWFVSQQVFELGVVLAAAAVVAWLLVPLGKFFKYVLTSPELARTRWRAIVSTTVVIVGAIVGIGMIPTRRHVDIEGMIEPVDLAVVYAKEGGLVETIRPPGVAVTDTDRPLATLENPDLHVALEQALARRAELEAQYRLALAEDERSKARLYEETLVKQDQRIAELRERLAMLDVLPPRRGEWISPQAEQFKGAFVAAGDPLGMVADPDDVRIRATVSQEDAGLLLSEDVQRVRVRVRGRPELEFAATLERVPKAGQRTLPSPAMSIGAGGTFQTDPQKPTETTEGVFEFWFRPAEDAHVRLLSGQRVVIRTQLPSQPLAWQWMHRLRQLLQRRRN